jgi:hypothetical protein
LAEVPAPDPITFEYAVERGDLRTVKRWLDEGLNPEYQAAHIGTGLMVAAWYGQIEMMALFVERGADLRRTNRHGEQALQLAAWGGHLEAVKWLLDRGAPLDRAGNQWGALHYAVFNGHEKVANDLLARGANVNARAPNGATPLMMAAREGHENLARSLLEAGANPKLQSDWGDSALTMAMRYDHLRLAKMISTPEDFAIAVKAPKESFGEATRSAAVTPTIDAILKEIRIAEAEGRPSEELHKKLRAAVNELRVSSVAAGTAADAAPLCAALDGDHRPPRAAWRRACAVGRHSPSTRKRSSRRLRKRRPCSLGVMRRALSAFDQAFVLGLSQLALDAEQRQRGPRLEELRVEALHQAQCVEHELERQIGGSNGKLFLHRHAGGNLGQILLRSFPAHLAQHAIVQRQLASGRRHRSPDSRRNASS